MKNLVLSSILAAAVVVACSSSSSDNTSSGGTTPGIDAGTPGSDASTTGTDAATGTDAGVADSGGGTDAGTCGTAALEGSGVPEVAGAGTQPVAAGGTIADGTYVLTKWEIYPPGSIDAYIRKETLVFSGNTLAGNSQTDSDPEMRNSGTFAAVGASLNLVIGCPVAATGSLSYTATPTEFKIIENKGNTHEVHTYTKK